MNSKLRLWFIPIFLVPGVLALVFGVMWFRRASIPSVPVEVPFKAQEAHEEWKQYVLKHVVPLSMQASSQEIRLVREGLIALKVTGQDRETHLSLVMGLLAWERGESGAYARLQSLLQTVQ